MRGLMLLVICHVTGSEHFSPIRWRNDVIGFKNHSMFLELIAPDNQGTVITCKGGGSSDH